MPHPVLIHNKDDEPSSYLAVYENGESVNAVHCKDAPDRVKQMREHASVQQSDKKRLKSD